VIVHLPNAFGFALLMALALTVQPAGGVAGAVYLPFAVMVPTTALPPRMPFTFHTTAELGVPSMKAVKRRSRPTGTLTEDGETVTVWAPARVAVTAASRSQLSASTR